MPGFREPVIGFPLPHVAGEEGGLLAKLLEQQVREEYEESSVCGEGRERSCYVNYYRLHYPLPGACLSMQAEPEQSGAMNNGTDKRSGHGID